MNPGGPPCHALKLTDLGGHKSHRSAARSYLGRRWSLRRRRICVLICYKGALLLSASLVEFSGRATTAESTFRKRPSFAGGGSDQREECNWIVQHPKFKSPTRQDWRPESIIRFTSLEPIRFIQVRPYGMITARGTSEKMKRHGPGHKTIARAGTTLRRFANRNELRCQQAVGFHCSRPQRLRNRGAGSRVLSRVRRSTLPSRITILTRFLVDQRSCENASQ